jgi:hypothetical protein
MNFIVGLAIKAHLCFAREREEMRENHTKNVFFNDGKNVAICCIAMITGESSEEKGKSTQKNSDSVFLVSAVSIKSQADKYRHENSIFTSSLISVEEIFPTRV